MIRKTLIALMLGTTACFFVWALVVCQHPRSDVREAPTALVREPQVSIAGGAKSSDAKEGGSGGTRERPLRSSLAASTHTGVPLEPRRIQSIKAFQLPGVSIEGAGAYYTKLSQRVPPAGMSSDRFHYVKNKIMDHLCGMAAPPSDLTEMLINLFHDTQQDAVTRDYTIQHLGFHWYGRVGTSERERIRNVIVEATRERSSSIGGTALLSMSRIHRTTGDFSLGDVTATVLEAAQDDNASELTRLTSVRLCADYGVQQAIPTAKKLAEESRSYALSLAAASAFRHLETSPTSDALYASVKAQAPCLNCDK